TEEGKMAMNRIRGLYWGVLDGTCKNLKVGTNVAFNHPKNITFGNDCIVLQNAVFAPLDQYNSVKYESKIIVGNRVNFGAFDRIASMNEVIIEDDVLFAAFVHVTDHSHDYKRFGIPIKNQGVFSKGPVRIKKGAWLAFGCHVLSGVTIGEYSVVAANAVVTKDVPPYTVVAGNPAKIVSQYDLNSGEWIAAKK
ncbi:MAG: acyltransferase, partial [Tannerellaceae bacterium]|nr:acyltransferase [Tannerellaceae bacterium]